MSLVTRVGFHLSAEAALVLTTTAMGMMGSLVVLLLTFTNRAVHETLERGALWWYLTRPITGAILGLLCYLAVFAGFLNAAQAWREVPLKVGYLSPCLGAACQGIEFADRRIKGRGFG